MKFSTWSGSDRREAEARLTGPEPDPEGFVGWLNSTFPLGVTAKDFDFSAGPEAVTKAALKRVRDAYEIKIKFEDPNALQSLERYTLLGSIDRLWQEHLYAIDSLRQSISLRTMGQRDPLIEYKREAFTDVFRPDGPDQDGNRLEPFPHQREHHRFRVVPAQPAGKADPRGASLGVEHAAPAPQEPSARSSVAAPRAPEPAQAAPERQSADPPRRTALSRNDPCPLGTGKKFKNCCGADGETKSALERAAE